MHITKLDAKYQTKWHLQPNYVTIQFHRSIIDFISQFCSCLLVPKLFLISAPIVSYLSRLDGAYIVLKYLFIIFKIDALFNYYWINVLECIIIISMDAQFDYYWINLVVFRKCIVKFSMLLL